MIEDIVWVIGKEFFVNFFMVVLVFVGIIMILVYGFWLILFEFCI